MANLTYIELTPKQKEQVATVFNGDAILGNKPDDYVYEALANGFVICRRLIVRTSLECKACHETFTPRSDYDYRGGICRKCWVEIHNP